MAENINLKVVESTANPEIAPAKKNTFTSLTEDWWAVILGLGIVAVAYIFYLSGSSISWIAVAPGKWSSFSQLANQVGKDGVRYLALFGVLLLLFTIVTTRIGQKPRHFIPAFTFVFAISTIIYVLGSWDQASKYTLEPPLVALALGLLIANIAKLPRWFDAGFRVEFYIKLGIILLGATLPFTLIIWAGPVAILQASLVSLATFLTIFFVGRKLGLDRRLAAVLGAGGAVCGVSASIAIAGSVRAKKEHPPVAISLVVVYAIIMIFVLPIVCRVLRLPAGIGGAWIGTSEFADAAGLAAAQSYGGLTGGHLGIAGTADQAVAAYTLIKVIGRDIWIGIWAFVLALISVTYWEPAETTSKVQVSQIWLRFPKFVIGFLVASILTSLIIHGNTLAEYNKIVKPALILPITALRTWAFTFSFFSIGLTTRFRELAAAGSKPVIAFTAGVVVNVILGYILSVIVFGHYWSAIVTH
ncbi:putative integral membrane protein (TIGR00698 family) [Mucilaginibacter yixingensis]|uniref:Putative integral membrane protein (TIGR00698 family) n=1 Tax=Mucilaginibacter yixingensis TaxID=1295612 RepID=A0A2T5J931_9SPHI|nr:putative sulfate exporter family transporter [Mucilaginibacter yixingensis]PTQ96575.1 putative integral membrane protein (TIGR00698 family) [Mucilaginibacter yixingensis]